MTVLKFREKKTAKSGKAHVGSENFLFFFG